MSAPPFIPLGPPPLPSGWSEHISPTGQPYYYNTVTKESSYVRPLPTFQLMPQPVAPHPKKKKEKPVAKTPIPGTDWLRVKTTEGNIFYTHKVKKESFWTVPDEIKEAVETLELAEEEAKEREAKEKEEQLKHAAEQEALKEIQRIKAEVGDVGKRKAEEAIPVDEVVITKKARVEDVEEDEDDGESEEEDWQREAAAQLAAEAEEEKKRQEEEAKKRKEEAEAEEKRLKQMSAQLKLPDRVDLSIEEAKALFKTLLREKDINPLTPWDTALPIFISDPRYVLLPSVSARREAFDEYCRDRARELRQSQVKKEKEIADPSEAFERLLKEEVKSTRTSWGDFRRQWKKDRRFYGWGRDDREREKRFRGYLKDLGERKRAAAQKAESNFFALLKERGVGTPGSSWKEVKRTVSDDPRYDAVGSSTLREELFNTFMKANTTSSSALPETSSEEQPEPTLSEGDKEQQRRERKERAVREREERVKSDRDRLEADINRSKMGLNKEEGEREFRTMLVDAIRDPQMTWDAALPELKIDPRFTRTPLPFNQQLHLFHTHIAQLRSKHLDALHALFSCHAPSLATPFSSLPLESILNSLPANKLGLDDGRLENEYDLWQRERTSEARKAFDVMLHENSFVEFWGRLRNLGGEGVEGGVKADDAGLEEDEGEAGGGKADMKVLAKSIDIGEMLKVLRNDKRYLMFDHAPEQRERWIRVIPRLGFPFPCHWLLSLILAASQKMRLLRPLLLTLTFLSSHTVWAQGATELDGANVAKEKHSYQSDVTRLRKIVINRLVALSPPLRNDVFLRELISNANDALEKLRLTSLTDKQVWDGVDPLNVTIKAVKNEDGVGGKLIIADTGIGMTPEELTKNLGTLAKSGTSEFLARAENTDATNSGNLIGAFGLGFYSSFLVADRVYVSSIPAKTTSNPNPAQYVFSSSSDESSFDIYPDPRGNTIGRGTEITLVLKEDAMELLEESKLIELVQKHSSFASSFPVYLWTERTDEVPIEGSEAEISEDDQSAEVKASDDDENEEVVVEEVLEDSQTPGEETAPKTKTVLVQEWLQLNPQQPLWLRDPKTIDEDEYNLFYYSTFKDYNKPLAWHHFSGDTGSGVSFKAIVFVPSRLEDLFWQQTNIKNSKDVRLMVKRVFITSDLGDEGLPKWASWVKVVIDAEDLPLNVSRETLQTTQFLKQIKQIIIRRLIQLFTRLSTSESEADKAKWAEILKVYGSAIRLGAIEDHKNREKLSTLVKFPTNQRDEATFDEYLENKKQGQKQIFYLADIGKKPESLAQSVFVEKLTARGYEVFLFAEPLDEILIQNLRMWKSFSFQDVAKAGLQFGDEALDPEEEKKEQAALQERFKPLLDYLKGEAKEIVRDVVISNRLVSSPCAIVADLGGYTANVERMMNAANNKQRKGAALDFAKKQKLLEINPRSPLIEGLLRRVEQLPSDEDERDLESEEELREVTSILIDGALVRSGFDVPDSTSFFNRVDRVLRRSLGVSETATGDTTVKPAPPVDPELPNVAQEYFDDEMDIGQIPIEMEETQANTVHDEL
ncbi:hypothetical protein JAAARDRAFT_117992 [Jaapia argillacea MUCL 33604]|uniref:HSP90-domain-containing protein n=1 Tax=Jaapia argillacea MUCL 33604 TaxID=933084 RepID=A0A067QPD6_9AGAM|nr:hypothetical protein JAAARDRAFT_117992 [Jaapia argillacea MUCL 33604]